MVRSQPHVPVLVAEPLVRRTRIQPVSGGAAVDADFTDSKICLSWNKCVKVRIIACEGRRSVTHVISMERQGTDRTGSPPFEGQSLTTGGSLFSVFGSVQSGFSLQCRNCTEMDAMNLTYCALILT